MKTKSIVIFMPLISISSCVVADDFQNLFSESHVGIKSAVIKTVDKGRDVCIIFFNKKKDDITVGFEVSNDNSKMTIMGVKSKSESAEIKLNGHKYKGVMLPLRKSGEAYITKMESVLYWDQKPIMYIDGRYVELPNINSYGFSSSISAYDDCVSRSYVE